VFARAGLEPGEDTVIAHFRTDAVSRAGDPRDAWPRRRIIRELRGHRARWLRDEHGAHVYELTIPRGMQ
jgi:hypothetical protein